MACSGADLLYISSLQCAYPTSDENGDAGAESSVIARRKTSGSSSEVVWNLVCDELAVRTLSYA
jgi:hypothetical protein